MSTPVGNAGGSSPVGRSSSGRDTEGIPLQLTLTTYLPRLRPCAALAAM
ncbi:hypothetical protein OHS18_08715 [Amycolatopsis sp. NBC_00355]